MSVGTAVAELVAICVVCFGGRALSSELTYLNAPRAATGSRAVLFSGRAKVGRLGIGGPGLLACCRGRQRLRGPADRSGEAHPGPSSPRTR